MKWGVMDLCKSLQISTLFSTMCLRLTLNIFMICKDTINKNSGWSASFLYISSTWRKIMEALVLGANL